MTEHADEIEFGSPEYIARLSREALEQDFAWMVSRNRELESICDRLDAENADIKKVLETMYAADPDPYGRRVLTAIDRLRRDLTGYHGQLKAHSDLQVHCDRQRERIADLEGLYAKVKAEADALRQQVVWMGQTDARYEAAIGELECAKAENAELRELVRDMWVTISWCDLDTYPSEAKKEEHRSRMRGLGIEVDG